MTTSGRILKVNMNGIIYIHHVLPENKYYVGQTSKKDPTSRWKNSSEYSIAGYKGNYKFIAAIRRNGWSHINSTVVETGIADQKTLNQREAYYMKVYNSLGEGGYNIQKMEEDGSYTQSTETKKKIGDLKRGKRIDKRSANSIPSVTCDLGNEHHYCGRCKKHLHFDKFPYQPRTSQTGKILARNVGSRCKQCVAEYKAEKFPYMKTIHTKEALQESYEARKQAMSEGAKRAYANDPTLKERASKARSKAIVAKDPVTDEIIHRFPSGLAAKEAGYNNITVSEAIKKGVVRLKFKWEFAE